MEKPIPRPRADGSTGWEARYREGGRRRSRAFDRREDAEHFLHQRRRQRQLGSDFTPEASRKLLDEHLDDWLRRGKRDWAKGTHELRTWILQRHVRDELGGYRLSELTVPILVDWHDDLADRATANQANKAHAALRAALSDAVTRQLISANPAAALKSLREPAGEGRALDAREVEEVRYQLRSARDRLLVTVMAYAGLRCEEALALRWRDVTPSSRITVRGAFTADVFKETKTGDRRVVEPITEPLRDDIEAYRSEQGDPPPSELVFPDRSGQRPIRLANWRRRVWTPAREDARVIKANPQDLRHTFASLRLAEQASLPQLQKQMGHKTWVTTMRHYAFPYDDTQHNPRVPMAEAILNARQRVAQAAQQRRETVEELWLRASRER